MKAAIRRKNEELASMSAMASACAPRIIAARLEMPDDDGIGQSRRVHFAIEERDAMIRDFELPRRLSLLLARSHMHGTAYQ